jgi:hypothetical protein
MEGVGAVALQWRITSEFIQVLTLRSACIKKSSEAP